MLEPSGELDLALEALGGHAGAKVGGEDLHDDAPAESCIGGDEYARHAAGAELVLDGVGGAEGRLELRAEVGQCLARWRPGALHLGWLHSGPSRSTRREENTRRPCSFI